MLAAPMTTASAKPMATEETVSSRDMAGFGFSAPSP